MGLVHLVDTQCSPGMIPGYFERRKKRWRCGADLLQGVLAWNVQIGSGRPWPATPETNPLSANELSAVAVPVARKDVPDRNKGSR